MELDKQIQDYYDRIAGIYDEDRFKNSYGQFIDRQENAFLTTHLSGKEQTTLDIACGTGRFLKFADYGIDISKRMIALAKEKYPTKKLNQTDAEHTHFTNEQFDQILCMHLFMHLTKEKTATIIQEAGRIIKPKGIFIFDIPSKKRRRLFNSVQKNWHGANEYTISEIKNLVNDQWKIRQYSGILFFPIHRIPKNYRNYFAVVDSWLCKFFLKEFSSYLIIVLEKK